MGFALKRGNKNSIWGIIDRFTKCVRFSTIKDTWSLQQLANAYFKEIVRLQGVPKDIVSNRDSKFRSHY